MDIQIVDTRATGAAHDEAALRLERNMTIEYRTLSVQLSRHNQNQARYTEAENQPFAAKWKDWMYRKLHIHGAYTQRQAEYNDEQRKLEATAGELDSLKFHLDTVDQTLAKFGTSPIQGLEDAAITRRRERDGPNTLSSPPNRIFLKLFEWLFSGFCPLLWIAAIFVWISWKPLGRPSSPQYLALGIAILIVIFLQAGFSAYQE
ncbi:hypothetical protein GGI05_002755 [Coemansia sp. RSA 2603]|nr:hypothetical protein GGI05_002755 [Coemansia sp. RSA 2603]